MLTSSGILGINARNRALIQKYNRRAAYPMADSKIRTKDLAKSVNIQVPELYGIIEAPFQVRHFNEQFSGRESFVIKPDQGSGGSGILVIRKRIGDRKFRRSNGLIMDIKDIEYHLHNTLSGMFSLGGQLDKALIEYPIAFDPVFDTVSYQGIPDIRIIVLNGKPLMGMLRLPTRASDGKANLHMGGIGCGVDMKTGKTNFAVQHNRYITEHPETLEPLRGLTIPYWKDMIQMAIKMQQASGLGYIGVDLVLDQYKGPMLLEINARPGISIQIANKAGLKSVLKGLA